jgi:hypothetical protein
MKQKLQKKTEVEGTKNCGFSNVVKFEPHSILVSFYNKNGYWNDLIYNTTMHNTTLPHNYPIRRIYCVIECNQAWNRKSKSSPLVMSRF